jgi:hypothetical protein
MGKETVVALPSSKAMSLATRTVLSRVIEELDKLLGFRGNNPALLTNDAISLTATELTVDYANFSSAKWKALRGTSGFSVLGSAITNAPFTVTASSRYVIHILSTVSVTGDTIHTVNVIKDGVPTTTHTGVNGSWS